MGEQRTGGGCSNNLHNTTHNAGAHIIVFNLPRFALMLACLWLLNANPLTNWIR